MNNYLEFNFNNQVVEFDISGTDVMVNATEMGRAYSKRSIDFLKQEGTKAFIDELKTSILEFRSDSESLLKYQIDTEAIIAFIEDTNKFTSISEMPTFMELITEYAEEGAPCENNYSELKRLFRFLRKTNILLQDFLKEIN